MPASWPAFPGVAECQPPADRVSYAIVVTESVQEIAIYDPKGNETGVSIRVDVPGASTIAEWTLRGSEEADNGVKLHKTGTRPAVAIAEEPTDALVEFLAKCTISWQHIANGKRPLEFSRENAEMLYTRFPFIRDQVRDVIIDGIGFAEIVASLAFEKKDRKVAQRQGRSGAAPNYEFARGNFEAAAQALAPRLSESRFTTAQHDRMLAGRIVIPLWTGEAVKRLAIVFVNGYGDGILFGRYLRALCGRVERVSAIVSTPLYQLFKQNAPPYVDVFDYAHCADGFVDADVHCYMEFLPHQSEHGYGEAAWITSSWQVPVTSAPARVGINWTGATVNPFNALRSINLNQLPPLLDLPGIEFHSLQVDQGALPPAGVIDHAHELHSFLDTANLIATLDLVISIDSAAANLAGSMGCPLWVLIEPAGSSDFRWGTAAERTPWFPSARMFRQGKDRKWKPVIKRVVDALAEWKAKRGPEAAAIP